MAGEGGGEGAKRGQAEAAVREVVPKQGLLYSEKGALSEVLCKPKIMPIKSLTLEKLERMEAEAAARAAKQQQQQ